MELDTLGFGQPPSPHKPDGALRRAGFEIELAGAKPAAVAQIVARLFDGAVKRHNPHVWKIEDTRFGAFRVELDARFLTEQAYRPLLERAGIERDSSVSLALEEIVHEIAHLVVPCEIVCPPIPVDALHGLSALEEMLRWAGAEGSDASVLNALGLQINIELRDERVPTVLAYLRAFMERYAWLLKEIDPGLTRRMTNYAAPFPREYERLVLDPAYAPTLPRFVDDYLDFNATRNRALDLLPMLAHLDAPRVLARAEEPMLVKPRPALHYRLPSCRLDDLSWSIALEWNRWLEVERRAEHWLPLGAHS